MGGLRFHVYFSVRILLAGERANLMAAEEGRGKKKKKRAMMAWSADWQSVLSRVTCSPR
jgi:hypothetical protein